MLVEQSLNFYLYYAKISSYKPDYHYLIFCITVQLILFVISSMLSFVVIYYYYHFLITVLLFIIITKPVCLIVFECIFN